MGVPGAITSMLGGQSAGQGAGPQGQAAKPGGGGDLIAVPAGLWGWLVSQATGVVGDVVGGQAGQAISSIGQTVGNVLPFSTIPSGAGPQGQAAKPGGGGDLIAVPAGLWGWLVSQATGVVGDVVGGQAGQAISSIGQTVGNVLPFSTIPSGAGPQGQAAKPGGGGDLIAVPAGLWGWLVSQATGVVGDVVGGQAGQAISSIGQTVGNVLPFSTIPSGAGPQGQAAKPGGGGDLIAVPAGLWGWLVSQATGVVGDVVGGQAGQAISSIGQTVGNVLPFSTIPSGAGPQGQAAKPGGGGDLIAVPAGLWGWLVSQATGVVGDVVGGQAGQAISSIGQTVGNVLPFSTIPSGAGA